MKKIISIVAAVVILGAVVLGIRFWLGGGEDTWLCVNGEWVKHGNPKQEKPPLTGCGAADQASAEYNWSSMNEGPFRDAISFAMSTDLINWSDSGQTIAQHASVPGVIVKDGAVFIYFVDVSEDGKPEQLGLIRSVDGGRTWSPKVTVTIQNVGERVAVDPAPVLLEDGRIRLFYFDIGESRRIKNQTLTNKIYSAISADGVTFTQEEGIRFERQGIYDPDIINVNGVWRMYVGDQSGKSVIMATSEDGMTFTEDGVAYTGSAVPNVVYIDGLYRLFVAGIDMATSTDGKTFQKSAGSFRSTRGQITADPSVVRLANGTWMMVYKYK